MPKVDKDIEELIKKNPKLAKYIEDIRKNNKTETKTVKKTVSGPKKAQVRKAEQEQELSGTVDPRKFILSKEVKKHPLYKERDRDRKARLEIDEFKSRQKRKMVSKNNITPGQLVIFKYLNPKSKEELEYYDASPCTIFFGIFNSKEGKRVLGFNIHYFPPQIRYRIMDKIYEMYKPFYRKYFETGLPKELDAFDYHYLVDELEKYNMSFAVRMYVPQLIGDTYILPPKLWPTALLTEGWFKKETRAAIMTFFIKDSAAKGITSGIKKIKKQDQK